MVHRPWTKTDVVMILAIPLLLVIAIGIPAYTSRNADRNTAAVVCTVAQQANVQLRALKRISIELGIPGEFQIPEVPAECESISPLP